jgi:hypothetical protein
MDRSLSVDWMIQQMKEEKAPLRMIQANGKWEITLAPNITLAPQDPRPHITVMISGRESFGLLDSGCCTSVLGHGADHLHTTGELLEENVSQRTPFDDD